VAVVAAGYQKGTKPMKPLPAFLLIAGGAIAGLIAVVNMTAPTITDVQASSSASVSKPNLPAECASDWHKCTTNAEVMESSHALAYSRQCKKALIEGAHYGTPKFKYDSFSFAKWLPGDNFVKEGKITLWEEGLQIQNGFGAWQNSTAYCSLDLDSMQLEVHAFGN
jgi:hypothetical protein